MSKCLSQNLTLGVWLPYSCLIVICLRFYQLTSWDLNDFLKLSHVPQSRARQVWLEFNCQTQKSTPFLDDTLREHLDSASILFLPEQHDCNRVSSTFLSPQPWTLPTGWKNSFIVCGWITHIAGLQNYLLWELPCQIWHLPLRNIWQYATIKPVSGKCLLRVHSAKQVL